MKLSKHSDRLTKEDEDAYLEDVQFARLNGSTEWEKSIPSYTLFQALEIFPEAKPIVRKELKEDLKEIQKYLQELDEYYAGVTDRINTTEKSYHKAMQEKQELITFCERHRAELNDKEKRIRFNLARIDGKVPKGEIGADEIERARNVKIESLYEGKLNGNKQLHGLCPFHVEKHPSFVIYTNENKWWCFGACGKGGDSIDFIIQKEHLDFINAVKSLL